MWKRCREAAQAWFCTNLTVGSAGHREVFLNLLVGAKQGFLLPMTLWWGTLPRVSQGYLHKHTSLAATLLRKHNTQPAHSCSFGFELHVNTTQHLESWPGSRQNHKPRGRRLGGWTPGLPLHSWVASDSAPLSLSYRKRGCIKQSQRIVEMIKQDVEHLTRWLACGTCSYSRFRRTIHQDVWWTEELDATFGEPERKHGNVNNTFLSGNTQFTFNFCL